MGNRGHDEYYHNRAPHQCGVAADVVLYAPATDVMTFTRAAAIVSGGALLVAWFAVAGSAPEQVAPIGDRTPSTATSGPGSLAAEVEQQAVRLRERLADAPVPHEQPRNPFSFGQPHAARARGAASPALAEPATMTAELPAVSSAPALVLMGIAEEPSFEGMHRTAIVAAGDEIYIVMEGQSCAGRYKVKTIGVDAIELEDVETGGLRRLALR